MGCIKSRPRHRRCDIVTDVESRSYGKRHVPQHEFLSDDEKQLISETWRQLANDRVDVGIDVFLRIFQLAPEAKYVFPSFSSLDDDQLLDDILFRSHATRFMHAVDSVMSNLDALDVIVTENLVRLGRHHAATVTGFHISYLAVFEMAMLDVWSQRLGLKQFDVATRNAWSKVFHLITARISDGFHEYKSSAYSHQHTTCTSAK